MNIFIKKDYRQIIEAVVNDRKRLDTSINFQQMANYVRIPKSYLSRVVHGKADLSTDQLFLVCQYLAFSERECEYMQYLLEYARSGIKARKEKLLREIHVIQAQNFDTEAHINAPATELTSDEVTSYYLDPLIQLTHICLAIPRYQENQMLLAIDLKVPPVKLLSAINHLERMRLIEVTNGKIKLLVENMHLPKSAPVYRSWRNQIKLQAINRMDAIADDQAYSFAVVFSANEEARREIQSQFLTLLRRIEKLVGTAVPEEAYQMSFELFPWTRS